MLHRKTSRFFSMTSLILLVSAVLAPSCFRVSRNTRAIYILGAVRKPGRYIIKEGERVTILKALEISGGLTVTADKGNSQIIRRENGSTSHIDVYLTEVLRGNSLDMELVAGDILVVPDVRKRFHPYDLYDSPPLEIGPHTSAFFSGRPKSKLST